MRSAQFKSIIDVFPYGAPELKKVMRQYLFEAWLIAVAGHIVLLVAFLFITHATAPVEQPAERVVRITKYTELEPPPSIALSTPAGVVSPPSASNTNPANLGLLEVIREAGMGRQGDELVNYVLGEELAAGLEEVTSANRTLSTGRGTQRSNGTAAKADVGGMLAGNGTSGIDDLLQSDLGAVEPVKLAKSGKVNVESLGRVSGGEEALGARSEESLRQVLTQNMGRLQYIFNKYLKTAPSMGGKLEVEVTIHPDGTVKNAVVLDSDFTNGDFEREILSAMRRWRYEPIASGEVKVVYPILFVRAN
jgi:TonB family protein